MILKGKVFLVTGGASGLGEACVRRFVAQGARVVVMDRDKSRGVELLKELGDAARFAETDVTDEKSVQKAIDLAWTAFGTLSGGVNCAGIVVAEKILNKEGNLHSLETFMKVINTNVGGTFNVIRLAVASMTRKEPTVAGERAVFINTASVAAYDGQIGQVAYAASKGGIAAMTLPLARELAFFGIRVMTIAPGIFETPMLASLPEKARTTLGQQVPFPPRLGKPAEFAALAQHIIENEMLNGEVIRLDGAIRMAPK